MTNSSTSILHDLKMPTFRGICHFYSQLGEYMRVIETLKYGEECDQDGLCAKIYRLATFIIPYTFRALMDLVFFDQIKPRKLLEQGARKLNTSFKKINQGLKGSDRPICAYFVSQRDYNGWCLGDPAYYKHHLMIRQYQKHFDVSPKLVDCATAMFDHLNMLKAQYPSRPIRAVHISCHGMEDCLDMPYTRPEVEEGGEFRFSHLLHPMKDPQKAKSGKYNIAVVQPNEFDACASDVTIVLGSCLSGRGENTIAKRIAKLNPGKRVFASTGITYSEKPSFKQGIHGPSIDSVEFGILLYAVTTGRLFCY